MQMDTESNCFLAHTQQIALDVKEMQYRSEKGEIPYQGQNITPHIANLKTYFQSAHKFKVIQWH